MRAIKFSISPSIFLLLAACRCGDQAPGEGEDNNQAPPAADDSDDGSADDSPPPDEEGSEGESEEEEEPTITPAFFTVAVKQAAFNADGTMIENVTLDGDVVVPTVEVGFYNDGGTLLCGLTFSMETAELATELPSGTWFGYTVQLNQDTFLDTSGRRCDDFDPDLWGTDPAEFMVEAGAETWTMSYGTRDDAECADVLGVINENVEDTTGYIAGWASIQGTDFCLNYAVVGEVVDGVVTLSDDGYLTPVPSYEDAASSGFYWGGPVYGLSFN